MDGILGYLLRCNDYKDLTVREVIEKRGFKEVYSGVTNNWELKFDEFSSINPGNLLVIGYDKDLDDRVNEWMFSYQVKTSKEDFTIYSIDTNEVINKTGLLTKEVEIAEKKIELPYLNPSTKFIQLPIESEEATVFYSVSRELTLPVELMSCMYLKDRFNNKTKKRTLRTELMSILGYKASFGRRDVPEHNGEMTLPFSMFTAKSDQGIKYIFTAASLSKIVLSVGKFISDKKRVMRYKNKIEHNKGFNRIYKKVLDENK